MQKVLKRANGSEVRITANPYWERDMTPGVDVFVHHRESPEQPWKLASKEPHPDWRKMSVSEYVERGRAEIYRLCSHGEIFGACIAARAQLSLEN